MFVFIGLKVAPCGYFVKGPSKNYVRHPRSRIILQHEPSIKKDLKLKQSLYTILQILSVIIFNKTIILQVVTESDAIHGDVENDNPLKLFNL